MNANEKQLLQDIDNLHQKLLQEPYGVWHGTVHVAPSCYLYCQYAEQLKDKIKTLRDDEHIKASYACVLDQNINSLYNSREVQYVRQNMSNHNEQDVSECMIKANRQIELEFCLVFQKIEELKQKGELT